MLVELAARVQLRKHDLHRRNLHFRVNVGRNAAPVILDRNAAVLMNAHVDRVRKAVGSLVDRVIDDFPENMVKPALPRRTDIHTGAQTHRVKPFENGYIVRIVMIRHKHLFAP